MDRQQATDRGVRLSAVSVVWAATCMCWFVVGCSTDGGPQPDVVALRNRAAGLMGQFRYDEAVTALRGAVEDATAPDSLRVDLAIALLNRRQDADLEESSALLESVIRDSPDDLRARYCRALLLFNEGEHARARGLFKRVADEDDADAYAAYYVGQCHASAGEHAEAVPWFARAAEIDPYLRSAYYGQFQSLRRAGEPDAARDAFESFQRLDGNPRARLAELKYTRMGPKAEVVVGRTDAAKLSRPKGSVFGGAVEIGAGDAADGAWLSASATDFLSDRGSALLLSGPMGSRLLSASGDRYEAGEQPPFCRVDGVNAALWGDFDNDGLVDVYLCRRGPNALWRQAPRGVWNDVTAATETAGAGGNSTAGACYDLDHDGDLDYLFVNDESPPEVLSNDRDGVFRALAGELGLDGAGGRHGMVIADLDGDDDADLLFLGRDSPNEVYLNDRLWRYSKASGFDELARSDIAAAVAIDANVDGQTELYTAGPEGVLRWEPDRSGDWRNRRLLEGAIGAIAAYDFDGDTAIELLVGGSQGLKLLDATTGAVEWSAEVGEAIEQVTVVATTRGPEAVTLASGSPRYWPAGAGRYPFVTLRLLGRTDKAAEMRTNDSGIGLIGSARVRDRWTPLPAVRSDSGRGQSLQARTIGVGADGRIDFIRVLWPDGVSQSELDLAPGDVKTIAETQRQAGSCPLLFVWDGDRYRFVADLLGAGGIGFNLGRADYYPPRPHESFLLPPGLLEPRDGRLELKLGEPMEEVCYFDAVRLVAYDIPPGWSMTLDERFAGLGRPPTGEPVFFRFEALAARAVSQHGVDVTDAVAAADGVAAPIQRSDQRFTGLTDPHSVTIEFDRPLNQLRDPWLRFHGWVEYAYSQSAFAAWQAGVQFDEPTIEARGSDGSWRVVAERFGYPAGTAREGSVRLPAAELPTKTTALRISSNMQVYWDRLSVIDRAPCPDVRRTQAELLSADVRDVGFTRRSVNAQRLAVYDYDDRPPLADTRHPAGYYTEFGRADALVAGRDDAVAIIGPGEELHLDFARTSRGVPRGWRRRWVVEADGWCKDADPMTRDSGTVGPLPTRAAGAADPLERDALHREYNTRFRSGY